MHRVQVEDPLGRTHFSLDFLQLKQAARRSSSLESVSDFGAIRTDMPRRQTRGGHRCCKHMTRFEVGGLKIGRSVSLVRYQVYLISGDLSWSIQVLEFLEFLVLELGGGLLGRGFVGRQKCAWPRTFLQPLPSSFLQGRQGSGG